MLRAIIREEDCVGCAKCLSVCPVDAIIGAPKFLHSILKDECIGCKLCIEPCPINCIEMITSEIKEGSLEKKVLAERAKTRYIARKKRLMKKEQVKLSNAEDDPNYQIKIRHEIQAAIHRVNLKRTIHEQASTIRIVSEAKAREP